MASEATLDHLILWNFLMDAYPQSPPLYSRMWPYPFHKGGACENRFPPPQYQMPSATVAGYEACHAPFSHWNLWQYSQSHCNWVQGEWPPLFVTILGIHILAQTFMLIVIESYWNNETTVLFFFFLLCIRGLPCILQLEQAIGSQWNTLLRKELISPSKITRGWELLYYCWFEEYVSSVIQGCQCNLWEHVHCNRQQNITIESSIFKWHTSVHRHGRSRV